MSRLMCVYRMHCPDGGFHAVDIPPDNVLFYENVFFEAQPFGGMTSAICIGCTIEPTPDLQMADFAFRKWLMATGGQGNFDVWLAEKVGKSEAL